MGCVAGRGVAVLAVATGRNPPDAIARFYAEAEIAHLPVLTDRGSALARAMGVMGLPATVLIDREGREVGLVLAGVPGQSERHTARYMLIEAGDAIPSHDPLSFSSVFCTIASTICCTRFFTSVGR